MSYARGSGWCEAVACGLALASATLLAGACSSTVIGGGGGGGAGSTTSSSTSTSSLVSTTTTTASTTSSSSAAPLETPPGPSCAGGLSCQGISCCWAPVLAGGLYAMGRSTSGTDAYATGNAVELPEHSATIAPFALDAFEVTVGRFRRFVEAYPGSKPADGAGAHPLIAGSGWKTAWNTHLTDTREALVLHRRCEAQFQTWTDSAGANEASPLTCVTWYEAFAFCAWDGGRLPTEAEWEYAAAGGAENRLFPWGGTLPSAKPALANWKYGDVDPKMAAGSHPLGNGRFGHRDLSGSVWEWALDGWDDAWFSGGGATCTNCANLSTETQRSLRGGGWHDDVVDLRAATRWRGPPDSLYSDVGFRCARSYSGASR